MKLVTKRKAKTAGKDRKQRIDKDWEENCTKFPCRGSTLYSFSLGSGFNLAAGHVWWGIMC